MGKTEAGTPKDLANRMKAKGLQKLRWYCQMCEKQCRDENGFKCHTMSESHQRQLLLFADDPDKYLDSFSEEFVEGYTSLLKRRFGTKRVHANNVYQEYIQDRHHIHMNATQWETLTDFVKWLGREGRCVVDETEKGWYVAYVDRDPETIRRQEQLRRKEKFEKDEEERMQEFIQRQIEIGKTREDGKGEENKSYSVLQLDEEGKAPSLNLTLDGATNKPTKAKLEKVNVLRGAKDKQKDFAHPLPLGKKDEISRKRSALEDIMEAELQEKKKKEEVDKRREMESLSMVEKEKLRKKDRPWLQKDIVVKIITKDLGSRYYKAKGMVRDVLQSYTAVLELLEFGTILKVNQAKLETVIPSEGRKVVILAGRHNGKVALLHKICEESFSAVLELEGGKLIEGVPYEDFSKLCKS